jgi:hypothetical protein
VRAGCGQAGQAAAHFCARLNAFKRLTPLLCNSSKSAFLPGRPARAASSPFTTSCFARAQGDTPALKAVNASAYDRRPSGARVAGARFPPL